MFCLRPVGGQLRLGALLLEHGQAGLVDRRARLDVLVVCASIRLASTSAA